MRLLVVALAFSSTSAFAACPNLAGKYSYCRSTNEIMPELQDVTITQKVQNGVTVYTLSATEVDSEEEKIEEMIADGKARSETIPDEDGNVVFASIKYTCSGTKLVGDMLLKLNSENYLDLKQTYQKKGRELSITYKGSVFGQKMEDVLICD